MNQVWLSRYAKVTVVAAFTLILIGSLVTTNGAGMAFADWPLSSSSVNPDGWWSNLLQRLEHGHRLFAELTGCLIGILCAWIWGNRWAVPAAFIGSGVLSFIASWAGAPRPWIAHIGLWSSALIFSGMLLSKTSAKAQGTVRPLTRWVGFAAFGGVVAQAILGGMRVTFESAGNYHAALVFRVLHGCFAQIEFCLLVVIAAMLSPGFCSAFEQTARQSAARTESAELRMGSTAFTAWMTFGLVFLQLSIGATMRHLGVGLVIPTFPQVTPDGSWLPKVHNLFVDINFAHTRIGALLVGCFAIYLAQRILRTAPEGTGLRGPAWLLLGLIATQIALGITVLVTTRAVLPTTLHVINGAAILATTLLVALKSTLLIPPQKPEENWGFSSGSLTPHQPGTAP